VKLFVAMPFGSQTGRLDPDAPATVRTIEFDEVWTGVIRPAVPTDWEAKRADALRKPGLIDQLYTEWLLEADIVLADLTFANPNVYYELGIRQALSRKSTVLIAHKETALPFDVRNQSVVHYDYFHAPSLQQFYAELTAALMEAAASPRGSPVHTYLPGLFVGRYPAGRLPDEEIGELRAEIERLRAAASIEQGTAAQFERRLTLRRALTDLLSRIIHAQLDNAKLVKEYASDATYIQVVSSTLNQESAFLLSEATLLIEQIPDFVGAVEYNTVAYALANAGEVVRAEEYYRRAIGVAKSPFERTMAQRSFAAYLFSRGRFDEARALYRDALTKLPEGDPYSRQVNGYTLQGWAWNEAFVAHDAAHAERLFAQAQREFELVENPMMRYQLLGALAAARQGTTPAEPSAPAETAPGLRDWWKKGRSQA
jgi:tetratricopeptide (TPR) repeat protein